MKKIFTIGIAITLFTTPCYSAETRLIQDHARVIRNSITKLGTVMLLKEARQEIREQILFTCNSSDQKSICEGLIIDERRLTRELRQNLKDM